MNLGWIKARRERDLVFYVLGWASTPNAVYHIDPPGCDALAAYCYTELKPLRASDFARYERIYLFAWSFGVWVAEQICRDIPLYRAIALNGTPYPASDEFGMRLRPTLRALQMQARSGAPCTSFTRNHDISDGPFPEPTLGDKADELMRLAAWSRSYSSAHLHWDVAYIAEKDEIFPPSHMRAYWEPLGLGTPLTGSHYPFADPHIVTDLIDTRDKDRQQCPR